MPPKLVKGYSTVIVEFPRRLHTHIHFTSLYLKLRLYYNNIHTRVNVGTRSSHSSLVAALWNI